MKVGDMVVARYDEERGIQCVGLVLKESRAGREVRILWSSVSNPVGWWPKRQLRVISSAI